MTETSSVHTIGYIDRPVRLGSVGHAVPYSLVRIVRVDADGGLPGECAVGEIGVVAMAGPGVFSGYLSDKHNRGAFVEPGWVNSGDLGRLDEDGYLWITGRAKDLIIRGGHNIDPLAIEEIFFQHPAVASGGRATANLISSRQVLGWMPEYVEIEKIIETAWRYMDRD